MLLRLVVKNLFSFKELTEFNTAPGRFSRLPHHVYKHAGAEVLKLNAIYGANGAGKSNMIRVIELLREIVVSGRLPLNAVLGTFKLSAESRWADVYVGIEFLKEDIPYYYGLTINNGIITEEELLQSGLGDTKDTVLFRRTDTNSPSSAKLEVAFSEEIMGDPEAALFPAFLKNEILTRNTSVLFHMKSRQNPVFDLLKHAADWFIHDLALMPQNSKPLGITLRLENEPEFAEFANDAMRSFNTGVTKIGVQTFDAAQFFGEDNKVELEHLTAELIASPGGVKEISKQDDSTLFLLHDGKVFAKRLYFLHEEDGGQSHFTQQEESDGTRKLLEYLQLWYYLLHLPGVVIIDEIERSIHPLMIKELIRKFSHDPNTKGQLIFSTHESNLLDQDILRPDEIWFAEKNKDGATELTTLSEFREHHTIDIRKGYLAGRYGGIPFLGNLKDLNWDKYAEAE